MKSKHFGSFVVTSEGIRLLDQALIEEAEAQKLVIESQAESSADQTKALANLIMAEVAVTRAAGEADYLLKAGKRVGKSGKPTANFDLRQLVELEIAQIMPFFRNLKLVSLALPPLDQHSYLAEITQLEDEYSNLQLSDKQAMKAYLNKIKKLGRKLLTRVHSRQVNGSKYSEGYS